MDMKSDAVKNNIASEPGIKINWKWSNTEMANMNIDILGTSELKWTGMG